jgi:hypothetical protein
MEKHPNQRRRKPLPPLPSQVPKRARFNSSSSLSDIQASLGLNNQEFNALKRAIRDSENLKPKQAKQHEEDEDWLDWAIKKGKQYGPELMQLFELL